MSKGIAVVIGAGSIGRAIARRIGTGRLLLLADYSDKALADAAAGLGPVSLPFLQPDQVDSSVHAYALSKRANSLRVQTAAAAWGKRGARVNAVSPGAGVIITPLAKDELSGPRAEWFQRTGELTTP